jgi:[acyl-carrier-protein] S-malonyltransferase
MKKTDLAFVFPGQGSQAIGMLKDLAEAHKIVEETFQQASDVLSYDLWQLVQSGEKEELNQTIKTQPAMLTAGVAVWRVWQSQTEIVPELMAGHSLGEYTALVCSGVIDFSDGVGLVAERARLMQEAVPDGVGAMAVILGLDDDKVREVCAAAAEDQVCEAVNYNTPGQVVAAGNNEAIERMCVLAKEAGAKRAQKLPVSVPSHCALMKGAAEKMREKLSTLTIASPQVPVIQNADASAFDAAEQICDALARQLYSPVRWVETIQGFANKGITQSVECGPGKVLMGMGKRIDKRVKSLGIFDQASLQSTLEAIQ